MILAGLIAPSVTGAIVQSQRGPGGYGHALLLSGILMLADGVLACVAIRPPRDAAALQRPELTR